MHIEKLEASIKQFITEERKENGNYKSLEDFVKRVNIGIETLQILIFVGAFRFTGKQKHELLIEARFLKIMSYRQSIEIHLKMPLMRLRY